MLYTIAYYNTRVQASIEAWPAGINASYVRIAEQMVASGPNLGLPYTRSFGDGLFEIRAKGEEGIGRAFFCSPGGAAHRHPARLHQEVAADPAKGIEACPQAFERDAQ